MKHTAKSLGEISFEAAKGYDVMIHGNVAPLNSTGIVELEDSVIHVVDDEIFYEKVDATISVLEIMDAETVAEMIGVPYGYAEILTGSLIKKLEWLGSKRPKGKRLIPGIFDLDDGKILITGIRFQHKRPRKRSAAKRLVDKTPLAGAAVHIAEKDAVRIVVNGGSSVPVTQMSGNEEETLYFLTEYVYATRWRLDGFLRGYSDTKLRSEMIKAAPNSKLFFCTINNVGNQGHVFKEVQYKDPCMEIKYSAGISYSPDEAKKAISDIILHMSKTDGPKTVIVYLGHGHSTFKEWAYMLKDLKKHDCRVVVYSTRAELDYKTNLRVGDVLEVIGLPGMGNIAPNAFKVMLDYGERYAPKIYVTDIYKHVTFLLNRYHRAGQYYKDAGLDIDRLYTQTYRTLSKRKNRHVLTPQGAFCKTSSEMMTVGYYKRVKKSTKIKPDSVLVYVLKPGEKLPHNGLGDLIIESTYKDLPF